MTKFLSLFTLFTTCNISVGTVGGGTHDDEEIIACKEKKRGEKKERKKKEECSAKSELHRKPKSFQINDASIN